MAHARGFPRSKWIWAHRKHPHSHLKGDIQSGDPPAFCDLAPDLDSFPYPTPDLILAQQHQQCQQQPLAAMAATAVTTTPVST
jgi:hypothetical protein